MPPHTFAQRIWAPSVRRVPPNPPESFSIGVRIGVRFFRSEIKGVFGAQRFRFGDVRAYRRHGRAAVVPPTHSSRAGGSQAPRSTRLRFVASAGRRLTFLRARGCERREFVRRLLCSCAHVDVGVQDALEIAGQFRQRRILVFALGIVAEGIELALRVGQGLHLRLTLRAEIPQEGAEKPERHAGRVTHSLHLYKGMGIALFL